MSQFRTEILPEKSPFSINYKTKSLFIGSCFSDNIGNILSGYKFPALLNPFGVLYNPYSVAKALEIIMQKKNFNESDLEYDGNKWFSYLHHGSFSSPEKNKVLSTINKKTKEAAAFLKTTDILWVTLGTAWYYRLIKSGEIVANCHKQPAKLFNHQLLTIEEIVSTWNKLISDLRDFNPKIKIVFTISPVRHWKDGAENNQLSKSILNVAVHQLIDKHEYCFYFPAYEIMIDDLRDYRFYEDDFVHPNKLAIEYIWTKFSTVFIEDKTIQIIKQIKKIQQALNHKILHPGTEEHKNFLINQLKKIKIFQKQHPEIDFTKEIRYYENELIQWKNIL